MQKYEIRAARIGKEIPKNHIVEVRIVLQAIVKG
jgi:hypothetical protein